jgi:hypothetical protein
MPWQGNDEDVSAAFNLNTCTYPDTSGSTATASWNHQDKSTSICTKGTVDHPHRASVGVGVLVYKRTRCIPTGATGNPSGKAGKCFTHKQGQCFDLSNKKGCAAGHEVSQSECAAAAAQVKSSASGWTTGSWGFISPGCAIHDNGGIHFNTNSDGVSNGKWVSVCKQGSEYYLRGKDYESGSFSHILGFVNTKTEKDRWAAKAVQLMQDITDKSKWSRWACKGEDAQLGESRIAMH